MEIPKPVAWTLLGVIALAAVWVVAMFFKPQDASKVQEGDYAMSPQQAQKLKAVESGQATR